MAQTLPPRAYWTYGLAFLGAHLAFMPLLILLLPRRVEAVASSSVAELLSWLLLVGGIVAGLAHIAAGHLSDHWFARAGNRRGLIAIGAGLLALAYAGFMFAVTPAMLFAALIFFQLALNCCFAPLGALLADHFPDAVKGRLGGLMNAALPASTLLVVPIAWLFPADDPLAFLIVGAVAVGCILPLLLSWPMSNVQPERDSGTHGKPARNPQLRRDFLIAWLARLLVQLGAAFVIGYIYLFITVTQGCDASWSAIGASEILAILTAPTALLAILSTLLSGYASDARSARRAPLCIAATIFAIGLAILASAPDPVWFIIAYALFQVGLSAFLSIDTALVAQLVAHHPRRGMLLGVMNLSNTMPSVIVPAIALAAFGDEQVSRALATLFTVFAVLAVLAAAMVLFIRSVR